MTVTMEIEIDQKCKQFANEVREIPEDMVEDVVVELAKLVNVEIGSEEYINIKNGIEDIRYTR